MERDLFKWVRQDPPKNVDDWERILTDEQISGPSAYLPVHDLCTEALRNGLLNGSNSAFLRNVARILVHVQPTTPQPKVLEELDFPQIALEIGCSVDWISRTSEIMTQHGLIVRSNGKDNF